MLAYVTGTVDQELLARNGYLAAENRILKAQLHGRLKLSDGERKVLGEIGHRLGRKAFADVANVARPDTILGWYRKLVARKFDGSKAQRRPGRPRAKPEIEQLIVRIASENRSWGYDRIARALANLGHEISDQTVGNVLRSHGLPPAPETYLFTVIDRAIQAELPRLMARRCILVAPQTVAKGARAWSCGASDLWGWWQAGMCHAADVTRGQAELLPEGPAEGRRVTKAQKISELANREIAARVAEHREALLEATALNVLGHPAFTLQQPVELGTRRRCFPA
jgi:hypothetical protein